MEHMASLLLQGTAGSSTMAGPTVMEATCVNSLLKKTWVKTIIVLHCIL
jgi:hypothetical protein